MKKSLILVALCALAGCAEHPVITPHAAKAPQVLIVQRDGTMLMNDRALPKEDVVIYPDGFGGERAAIKVQVPLKSDFYRDSIRVEHEGGEPVSQN